MGIRRFYNDPFYILRYTVRENQNTGQDEKIYVKENRVYYGNLQPVSAVKQTAHREDSLKVTDTLECDTILLGSFDRIECKGNMYFIKGRPKNPGNRGHHLELELERIE